MTDAVETGTKKTKKKKTNWKAKYEELSLQMAKVKEEFEQYKRSQDAAEEGAKEARTGEPVNLNKFVDLTSQKCYEASYYKTKLEEQR